MMSVTPASVAFSLLLVLASFASTSTALETRAEKAADAAGVEEEGKALAPKVLKLERKSVMLPKAAARAGRRKNFYSAKINVGTPAQEFHMSFDLGGGAMVLPSQSCTSAACLKRRRYDRWISESAEDINADGHLVEQKRRKTLLRRRDHGSLDLTDVDVGAGKVRGTFVRDQVCIRGSESDGSDSEPRCFPLAMLVAGEMSDTPFLNEPYDGAVGVGLSGMSVSTEFNFLAAFHNGYGSMALHNGAFFPNSFGLHIGSDEDGGEITFGGYDVKRMTHPLKWAPVADPQDGRWQVTIAAIRMGNSTFEACRDHTCRAAIDYSSTLLSVPSKLAHSLEHILAELTPASGFGDGCQHLAIPDLQLQLSDDVTITVPAEDFVSDFAKPNQAAPTTCKPLLSSHEEYDGLSSPGMFVLGEATLRRYYTFFNADSLSVGFSLAAGSLDKSTKALPDSSGGKKKLRAGEDPVILLVQVKVRRSKTVSSLGK
jgi:hypothetical protein